MVMAVVSLAAAAESAVEARAEAEEAVMTAAEVEGTAVARGVAWAVGPTVGAAAVAMAAAR